MRGRRLIGGARAPSREHIEVDDFAGEAADHLARYAFAAHWVPGQTVADVCCGLGYGTNLLAVAGAKKVYGVDSNSAAVDKAAMSVRIISHREVLICFEGISSTLCARDDC